MATPSVLHGPYLYPGPVTEPLHVFTMADDLRRLCIVLTSLVKKQDDAETSRCLLLRHALVLTSGSRLLAWPMCLETATPLLAFHWSFISDTPSDLGYLSLKYDAWVLTGFSRVLDCKDSLLVDTIFIYRFCSIQSRRDHCVLTHTTDFPHSFALGHGLYIVVVR